MEIREKYGLLEIKQNGKEWSVKELAKGFLRDVNELINLIENSGDRVVIAHEISDCLWSILVLAHKLNIDLEASFMDNMDKLSERIDKQLEADKD